MKTAFERLTGTLPRLILGSLMVALVLSAGWSGFAGPIGPFKPPLATIDNPSPAFKEGFGYTVVGVGTDRFLIGIALETTGAPGAGAAYLFNTNGGLIRTFTKPIPVNDDRFGSALAAFGSDRVLIGAWQDDTGATNAGAAYLFNTDGVLLTAFTNPPATPNDHFGYSVAAVGTNRVLVGAPHDNTGAEAAGMAYLFETNGVLVATYHNPTPSPLDAFGTAVAGVGHDLVLIGAYQDDTGGQNSGAAYLFDSGGTLLTTLTNPAPVGFGNFGWSVAGMGRDRLLVGAEGNTVGGVRAGSVYLFNTGGVLLATFTNPAPVSNGRFGHSVAVVGDGLILIGAPLNANRVGGAYLFDTNGVLVSTVFNPTPESSDQFGYSADALGPDRLLVGAYGDNTGAESAGAAYLFAIPGPLPPVNIAMEASTVSLSWVSPDLELVLQEASQLGPAAEWTDVAGPVSINGPTNLMQQPLGTTNRFFRLRGR